MVIGKMIQKVIFKQNNPSATNTGGGTDSYSTLLTTRCRLEKSSGSRNLSFGEVMFSDSYDMTVRFQTLLESNLRSDMKVEIDGVTYTINSFQLIDQKKDYYKINIQCQQV